MDRLTKHNYKFDMLNVMQGLNKYTEIDEIMNRLAAYEDTGLMPEQIQAMQGHNTALIAEVERLQNIVKLQKASCSLKKTVEAANIINENATLKKALELACERTSYDSCPENNRLGISCKHKCLKCWEDHFIQQAEQLTHETHGDAMESEKKK